MSDAKSKISAEQLRFAATLEHGTRWGLGLLVVGFFAYVLGWVPATVPLESLSQYWGMPVAAYRQATGAPDGWGWLSHFGAGETLPLVGIVVLCSTALAAFFGLILSSIRRRDWAYAIISVLEVAVLLLAASGVLTAH